MRRDNDIFDIKTLIAINAENIEKQEIKFGTRMEELKEEMNIKFGTRLEELKEEMNIKKKEDDNILVNFIIFQHTHDINENLKRQILFLLKNRKFEVIKHLISTIQRGNIYTDEDVRHRTPPSLVKMRKEIYRILLGDPNNSTNDPEIKNLLNDINLIRDIILTANIKREDIVMLYPLGYEFIMKRIDLIYEPKSIPNLFDPFDEPVYK